MQASYSLLTMILLRHPDSQSSIEILLLAIPTLQLQSMLKVEQKAQTPHDKVLYRQILNI